ETASDRRNLTSCGYRDQAKMPLSLTGMAVLCGRPFPGTLPMNEGRPRRAAHTSKPVNGWARNRPGKPLSSHCELTETQNENRSCSWNRYCLGVNPFNGTKKFGNCPLLRSSRCTNTRLCRVTFFARPSSHRK